MGKVYKASLTSLLGTQHSRWGRIARLSPWIKAENHIPTGDPSQIRVMSSHWAQKWGFFLFYNIVSEDDPPLFLPSSWDKARMSKSLWDPEKEKKRKWTRSAIKLGNLIYQVKRETESLRLSKNDLVAGVANTFVSQRPWFQPTVDSPDH